ncbi:protein strawberry notch [Nilaparvata lugens]|uniref:protein strawberry notch n=1 Tax=Nilaparvata lugens TaxID=108931 RepID=UPI00193DE1C5|nr:protein strawberry notch [Nilaparvata lugens]
MMMTFVAKLGKKHPDPVVETASLSSVEPTDVWYKVSLPDETINSGSLSALQLEAITYASQQHEHFLPDGTRAGFLIGDGAGVGKGRTIAGIIFENYLKGRKKAIWVSVSNDLKYDSERDLKDIGANKIDVYSLNKFKYAKISSAVNGHVKKGVIFSTYSALIGESTQSGGKYKTRLKQLLQWCGDDFDGLIVFDECHRAKNLCPVGSSKPTKTGLTVLELQNKLPKSRVVYASATGASEASHTKYMIRERLDLEPLTFTNKMFSIFSGVGAMEIVAMDMKLRGMYIARQLSFHGVAFKVEEVPLSNDFVKIYDDSVKLWVEAMQKFQEAAELIDAENRMKKTMWGQFWSSHQRFFKYLCIAAKVKHAVQIAREAVKCGKCVVIGLQSTGEARTLEQLERDDGELSDFVSTAKGVLQTLVEKHFPAPDRSRIQRLLGLEIPKKSISNGDAEASGSSTGKRKQVRQAAARAVKRVRKDSSESDMENGFSSGSEFKLSGGSSPESEVHSDDSRASSDFNPFDDGSDSDDPWVSRKKKGRKKVPTKKRQTTQDKIDSILFRHRGKGEPQKGVAAPPPRDAIEGACSMKEQLLSQIESLGDKLPPNTLDQLIDELGGPENVAEMTGRKGRVVQTEDGGIQYESRSEVDVPLETLNITEKQRFMDGEKDVAIISEAASSGISLQSDRRARNQRRRVHITLELPWSADRAIQQFGRTHRSNQVNAPEYIFLISDLAGERRFASIVAKRLESLGALTHGDRRATETRDLSRFNIDNKYGRAALEATMKTIMGYEAPLVPPPRDYKGDFFKDVANALVGVGLIINSDSMPGVLMLDKDYNNMSKFLNRILGMPVELQNRLFKYFTDTLQAIIMQAKKSGRFDLGILDLGTTGENVKRVKLYTFLRKHSTGSATTELHIVHVERGMSWEEAMESWSDLTGEKEGFYLSHQIRNGKQTAILAVASMDNANKSGKKGGDGIKKDTLFTVYRPNTGLQLRQETLGELEKKYKSVSSEDAESHWRQQYTSSETTCSHAYWRGNCKNVSLGLDCEVGLRRRTYNVLSGSVLSVWARVENVLAQKTGHNSKMQVVRLRTGAGIKIVGTLIPKTCVELLREALASDAEKTNEESFTE